MTEPWRKRVVIGDAELYLGDAIEVLRGLRDGCQCGDVSGEQGGGAGIALPTRIDCVITSPPYAQQRDYGAVIEDWDGLMRGVFSDLLASDACQILVNLGQIHRDGEVICYWEPWRDWMRAEGWRFFGFYVWDKGFGAPGNWNGRLGPAHEFIFHFNKKAIEPNKWTPTNPDYIGRKKPGTGMRRADGTMSGISSPHKMGQPFKVADSVLRITPQQARNGPESAHPAVFPVRLPQELALSFTTEYQSILDPFMGSGTTGVACMNLGRRFVGIEIEEKYFNIACERIENAQRQAKLFDEPKPKPEQMSL